MNSSYINFNENPNQYPMVSIDRPLIQQHQNRNNKLNARIYSRYFADKPLEPLFDPRSTPTKYDTTFIDNNSLSKNPAPSSASSINKEYIRSYVKEEQNPKHNFTSLVTKGNVNFFLENINTETILRNQTFAIQKGGINNLYIPNSNSELYKVNLPLCSAPVENPFPFLFKTPRFESNARIQPATNTATDPRIAYLNIRSSTQYTTPHNFNNVSRASLQ